MISLKSLFSYSKIHFLYIDLSFLQELIPELFYLPHMLTNDNKVGDNFQTLLHKYLMMILKAANNL